MLTVYLLCAEWCTTCLAFRPTFEAVARAHPAARMAWVDVEDEAGRVEPIEIQTFPTLLLVRGDEPLYFAPIRPQREHLERLLAAAAPGGVPPQDAEAVRALVARLAMPA